jgi:hypothetical protein
MNKTMMRKEMMQNTMMTTMEVTMRMEGALVAMKVFTDTVSS